MSSYEVSILVASLAAVFGTLALVASLTNKGSFKVAVFFLAMGGGLFYYAHISNFDSADLTVSLGLDLSDIPDAMYKLAGKMLN